MSSCGVKPWFMNMRVSLHSWASRSPKRRICAGSIRMPASIIRFITCDIAAPLRRSPCMSRMSCFASASGICVLNSACSACMDALTGR